MLDLLRKKAQSPLIQGTILIIVLVVAGIQVFDRFAIDQQGRVSGIDEIDVNAEQRINRVTRVQLALPAGQEYEDDIELSSNGNDFAYVGPAESGNEEHLWHRSLDSLEAKSIFSAGNISSFRISHE